MITYSGRTANVGIVTGIAKVYSDLKQLGYDEKCDNCILVVHNLTPDIIIFLKDIIGIVAEVGGITSHAATIAREMNIPCLVNVQNVTSIIRSGDIITLDGTNSEITILERGKNGN